MKLNHPERLLELDVLRGLAALGVLCFHYTNHYVKLFSPPSEPWFNFPFGLNCVHLFFMISGFVIFMTLNKIARPIDFIISRFSRLYPCYWSSVLITFIIVKYFHLEGREVTSIDALINMSMLQDWFNIKRVDGVYWTLSVELSFYIIMFLLFTLKYLKHIESIGLAWLALMILNDRLYLIFHHHLPQFINTTGLLTYGNLFIAGIFFYNLRYKGKAWYRYAGIAICFTVQYMFRKDGIETLFIAAFFLVFYLFVKGYLKWIVNKPMVFLGTISYSLYLVHQNIGYIIIKHLYDIQANAFIRFIVPCFCSIILASMITYFIEKPAICYIKKKCYLLKQNASR